MASTTTPRASRITELREFTKKLVTDDPVIVIGDLLKVIEDQAVMKWSVSTSTARDYANNVKLQMPKEFALLEERERKTWEKLQVEQVNAVSREKTFMDVFRNLSGGNNDEVEHSQLLESLVSTGRFAVLEARQFVNKFSKEGWIYERRSGWWAKS